MVSRPTERLALFIDGPSLSYSAKGLGLYIEYKRLLAEFRTRGVLARALYYCPLLVEEQEYSPVRPLVDWLDYNGFTVVTKNVRALEDAQPRKGRRSDLDVHLTVDMLELAHRIDHAVLFSGGGEFCPLVQAMQRKGVRVTVVSTIKSGLSASDELRRQADAFIDLADIADVIGRPSQAAPGAGDNAYSKTPGSAAR